MERDDRVEIQEVEQELRRDGSVEIVRRDGFAIVTPEGELDIYSAPMLRATLHGELDADRSCIVDLRKVSFVDSSILSALLDAQRYCKSRGLGFALVLGGPHSPVRRLIEVVMIALPVHDDLDTAMATLVSPIPTRP